MWVDSVKERTYRKEEAIYSDSGTCQGQDAGDDVLPCSCIVANQSAYAHAGNDERTDLRLHLKLVATVNDP